MHLGPTRALALFGVLAMAAAQIACVDHRQSEPRVESAARQSSDDRRDRQLAWLGYWQAQLAAQANGDAEREALRRRVALLEAENAALTARLDRLAAEGVATPRATAIKRRLDPMVPWDLAQPPTSGKREGTIFQRAARPARPLDPKVPWEPSAGALTQAPRLAPPAQRTLDEYVPY